MDLFIIFDKIYELSLTSEFVSCNCNSKWLNLIELIIEESMFIWINLLYLKKIV